MKKLTFLFFLIVLFSISCENKLKDDKKSEKTFSQLKSAISEGNNSFAFSIFKKITSNETEGSNVFISPLSMYFALALAGNGSAGETEAAFNKVLGFDDTINQTFCQAIADVYSDLIPNNDNVTVEIANSLWPAINFPIKDNYISQSKEYFKAEVKPVDFGNPETVNVINGWIEDKTHGKIQKMLSYIPGYTPLLLVNAIYFKGKWKFEFADSSNYDGTFSKTDGSQSNATFMRQSAILDYYSNSIFSSIKLPYNDTNFCMTILLPDKNHNTNEVIANLSDENWKSWNAGYRKEQVNVTIPKFKYSFGTRNISSELIDLGLGIAFSGQADFSKITDSHIQIDQVLHKAYMEVNEEGTEAAAATVISFSVTACLDCEEPQVINFVADKPFVFIISEVKSQTILFTGLMNSPVIE